MKEKIFKKGIVRRLFSVTLAVAMVLSLMSVNSLTAFADAQNVSTFVEFENALANSGEYKLTQDIQDTMESGELKVDTGKDVTIDLNGYSIILYKRYIYIKGTLTIIDSSTNKTGSITGASISEGYGTIHNSSGTLNLYGGTITGNTTSFYGGGIFNGQEKELNVGGTARVIGNTATEDGSTAYNSNIHFQNNDTTNFKIITEGENAIVTSGAYKAQIGLRLWNPTVKKVVTTIPNEDVASCFVADNSGYGVYVEEDGGVKKLVLGPHTHVWNYKEAGATLKAWCPETGCSSGHTDEASAITLTLTANDTTYSGNPVNIEPGDSDTRNKWQAALGGGTKIPKVMYEKYDGLTWISLDSSPREVGKYRAYIYPVGKERTETNTAYVDFEITKNKGPAAPTLTPVKPSTKGGKDGKITGVDTTMEYSLDEGKTWNDVPGKEISGLSAGKVSVRVKETDTVLAGDAAEVTVPEGDAVATPTETKKETSFQKFTKKSTVTVPKTTKKNGVTYTVTSLKKNAFDGKYVKKVVLPATITKISSEAFSKDNKLRSLKITSKKLTVGKNAFKGIKKANLAKIKVTVSKKMSKKNFNALKKNLIKQGLKSKNIVRK